MIFCAWVSDSEPPNTVKSLANTNTVRPLTVPQPVTTPSPGILVFSMPKSLERCSTNMSNSSNEPLSSRSSMRSRAVSLPRLCCASMRASPPPRRACSRRCSSLSRMSFMPGPSAESPRDCKAKAIPRRRVGGARRIAQTGRLGHEAPHEFTPRPQQPRNSRSRRRSRCTARASTSLPCSAMWRSCSRTRATSTRSITSP